MSRLSSSTSRNAWRACVGSSSPSSHGRPSPMPAGSIRSPSPSSRTERVRALAPRLAATLLGMTCLLALGGCRCGTDDESAQTEAIEPSAAPTIETRTRSQTLRTLVIADASQLDEIDLSTVESLDLALSERDGQ